MGYPPIPYGICLMGYPIWDIPYGVSHIGYSKALSNSALHNYQQDRGLLIIMTSHDYQQLLGLLIIMGGANIEDLRVSHMGYPIWDIPYGISHTGYPIQVVDIIKQLFSYNEKTIYQYLSYIQYSSYIIYFLYVLLNYVYQPYWLELCHAWPWSCSGYIRRRCCCSTMRKGYCLIIRSCSYIIRTQQTATL